MNKFQNYKHYKLPITIEPLKYGKLILNILELNLFVIQINKTNIALINQYEELSKDSTIFTKGISTDVITFTKDYQKILTIQLGDRSPYLVTHENSFCKVLVSY
jgi:alpha-D-ribose 1-methylphosphonate 5-triphosphate synthase subunit PhnI